MEDCSPAPSPLVKPLDEDEPEDLPEDQRVTYGTAAGIILFYSKYRTDLQLPARMLCRARRSEDAWKAMKRTVRYMEGTRDEGVWIPADGDFSVIRGSGDTDWATNKEDRKSVVCGIVKIGTMPVLSFVRTHKFQSLSSGEAEFYGQVSVAAEMLLLRRVMNWLGYPMRLELETDSTAALGMAARSGVGRVKHLELKALWLQRFIGAPGPEGIKHIKVGTLEMCADLGTKVHPASKLIALKELAGIRGPPSDEKLNFVKPKLLASKMAHRLGLAGTAAQQMVIAGIISSLVGLTESADVFDEWQEKDRCIAMESSWRHPLCAILVFMMVAISIWEFARRSWCQYWFPQLPRVDKQCQSQTTYRWKNKTPCFHVLGQFDQGCDHG